MSLMIKESRGNAGAINQTSGASGLIQVMPDTLGWYNKATGSSIPLSTMRAGDENSAAVQLRVGLWVLGRFWKSAYQWLQKRTGSADIPLDELVRWADAFYAAGPGKVQKLAKNLSPTTWPAWATAHPTSTITAHGNYVWDTTREQRPTWNLTAIDEWVKTAITPENGDGTISPSGGLLLALFIAVIGIYLLKGKL